MTFDLYMIFKGLKYYVAVFGELPHYSSEPFIYQLVLQLVVDVSTLYCAAETMVLLCKKLMTDQDICYCAKSPFNCPHTLLMYLSVQCCIIFYYYYFFCIKILHCTSRVECKDNISS